MAVMGKFVAGLSDSGSFSVILSL